MAEASPYLVSEGRRSGPLGSDDAAVARAGGGEGPASSGGGRPWRKRSAAQPRGDDHLLPWLALVVCVLLGLVPLVVDLRRPDVSSRDEARAIVTSIHTWRDAERVSDGGMTLWPTPPRYNGEPVVDRPPGLAWLHMVGFATLDHDTATPRQLVTRARSVSVVFGLLAIASVFWIGLSIGGLASALLAGLVAGTAPLLVGTGRLGTVEMPALGLALFATAAALWGARPFKPPAALFRQAAGWVLCGIALGALVLVAGLAPLPKVLLPLAVVLAICPRRISYVIALSAATFVAALMIVPWALYVHEQDPAAWRPWLAELRPDYGGTFGEYLRWAAAGVGWLAVATLPWTPWLLGGLIQPFSTSSVGSRQRLFAGWAWFVALGVVVLALPPAGDGGEARPVEMLLLLPAAAMLVGQVFQQYKDLSEQGRHVRFWTLVRYPHVVVLLAASVCLPMALAQESDLIAEGWLRGELVAPMGWLYWTGMALVLLLIGALSLRFMLQHHPARTLVCWAVWATVAVSLVTLAVARGPRAVNPLRMEAAAVARLADDAPLGFFQAADGRGDDVDPILMLYAERAIPRLTAEQVRAAATEGPPLYLLTSNGTPPGEVWRLEYPLQSAGMRLWHSLGRQSSAPEAAPRPDMAQP